MQKRTLHFMVCFNFHCGVFQSTPRSDKNWPDLRVLFMKHPRPTSFQWPCKSRSHNALHGRTSLWKVDAPIFHWSDPVARDVWTHSQCWDWINLTHACKRFFSSKENQARTIAQNHEDVLALSWPLNGVLFTVYWHPLCVLYVSSEQCRVRLGRKRAFLQFPSARPDNRWVTFTSGQDGLCLVRATTFS